MKKVKINNIKRKIEKFLNICFLRGSNLIGYMEAKEMLKENARGILLDVRSIQEYNEYHLSGAICIPLYELQQRIETVVPNKENLIIVYCQTGHRSQKAMSQFKKMGYTNVYGIEGGIDNL